MGRYLAQRRRRALAVALAIGCFASWCQGKIRSTGLGRLAVGATYTLVPALLMVTQYRDYLSQPLFGITVKRYNSRDFWGQAHGDNVRRITDPDDSIFVFGHDTSVYYYAKRRCASRFGRGPVTARCTGYLQRDFCRYGDSCTRVTYQPGARFMNSIASQSRWLLLILMASVAPLNTAIAEGLRGRVRLPSSRQKGSIVGFLDRAHAPFSVRNGFGI